ncbi:unnamed protein product [Phytophthora fragariaefolia]|uniref:Unnamed protein product n=1 Tax=Phytophthora fragariaefolia TaxID=1490495 RepID=A0A9W6XQE4_9STRA|nr:unnamed protein product [Phytophthora fragariaefolia]
MDDKAAGLNTEETPKTTVTEPDLPMIQCIQREGAEDQEANGDFIALDISDELSTSANVRYFSDVESRNLYGNSLRTKVEEDPTDTDAWLFLAIYQLELDVGLSMAEGIYWRLLEHLARVNSSDGESQVSAKQSPKELSILLTAICFHLCIKLWYAGATKRVIELLSALLDIGNVTVELGWCKLVRDQLRGDEMMLISLVFAHALVFNELHKMVEHWVAASSYETIPIKAMAYTIESLKSCFSRVEEEDFEQILIAYKLAFQTYAKKCCGAQEVSDVILTNWMLLIFFQEETASKRNNALTTFLKSNLPVIQQFPAASLTAAKIMMLRPSGEQGAHELMLAMMNQSSQAIFPEALHHYLFACRQYPALVNALDKVFPDVMQRLASILNVDIEKVETFIQDIMHDTSNLSKARALNSLLDALLSAWMGQLAQLYRDQQQLLDEDTNRTGDIFVALDICLLMGVLLEPSAAIEGLHMILSSSYFGSLPFEAQQLAWVQRFIFEVDLFQLEDIDSLSWRENQARLTKLLRKYMHEMSVETEMFRQVTKRIKYDMERNAVEDAVCDCLYPERSRLLTYDVNLEIFRLCLAAVADPDKTTLFASFAESLALSSDFSLAFSGIALHEWELLAARASLRKCLDRAKTRHPQILQALVAVELRLRNMKAVSALLESEMRGDPLLLETWRLAIGLEILFGKRMDKRSETIATEMEKRELVLACNTYGDDQLESKGVSLAGEMKTTSLSLRGLRLELVPNAILLKNELVSLDLSGNELTEVAMDLNRLKNLQVLDISENALFKFPKGVDGLQQLKELRLAHNNMDTVTIPKLPHLFIVDIRWNAVVHLSTPAPVAVQKRIVLRAQGNAIPEGDLLKISNLTCSRKDNSASFNVAAPTFESGSRIQTECKQHRDIYPVDPISEKDTPEIIEMSGVSDDTKSANTVDIEMTSIVVEDVATTNSAKGDDGDEVMNQSTISTWSTSKGVDVDEVAKGTERTTSPGDSGKDKMVNAEESYRVHALEEVRDGRHTNKSGSEIDEQVTAYSDTHPPKEVIDIDDSESVEGSENSNNITDLTLETANNALVSPMEVESSTSNTTGIFERGHSDAFTAAASRRRYSNETVTVVQKKLAAYMEQTHTDNRADVRRKNPTLWREVLAASLPVTSNLPACRLCFTPNDGRNQRLNSTVLCVHCLQEAVCILKERKEEDT